MSEKRFYRASVCGDEGLYDKKNGCIISNVRSNIDIEENWNTIIDLLNDLNDGNGQLKQILKDIVEVTDETYTKNRNMFKVTVVLDYKKYLKIKECIK